MRSDEEFECMLAEKKRRRRKCLAGRGIGTRSLPVCVCVLPSTRFIYSIGRKNSLFLRAKKGSKKEIPVYSEMCVWGGIDILWCFERCRREFPPPPPPPLSLWHFRPNSFRFFRATSSPPSIRCY